MPAEIPEETMLDAAVEAVVRHGYAGATTKRIAEIAGIGEATLFRRFGTKEGLLQAALRAEAATFTSETAGYTGDLRADLARVVGAYQRVMEHRGRLALNVLADCRGGRSCERSWRRLLLRWVESPCSCSATRRRAS